MANKFQITISAVDRATAVVRRINGNMSRLTRPVAQLGQSIRSLGREMGFDRLGSRALAAARAVGDVGGKVVGLLGPLGTLTAGGILAGLVAMTLEWAHMGSEIAGTSQALDIQIGQLQSLRGAAALAGVGAHELTGGLKGLGDTLEDALYGRNQQALVVLNRLGIGIHHTANGSIDAARGMRDLSAAIAGVKNVQVQGLIARTFGLEALLPLLRKGPSAIAAYEQKVAELGGVMSQDAVEAAQKFQLSLHYVSAATEGVRNAIGAKLVPILQPLVDRFTAWTAANRDLIATKVAEFVDGLVQRINELDLKKIGNDIHDFVSSVEGVVDAVGGWKNAAIGLIAIMNGSLIASVLNLGMAVSRFAFTLIPVAVRAIGLLFATPAGPLLAAIAAVAFGVYAIYRNWDDIVGYFRKKIDAVKAAFDRGWLNGIVKMLTEFNPTRIAMDALNGLSKWLFNFDLYEAGSHVLGSMIRGMKGAASIIPKSVRKFLGIEDWVESAAQPSAPPAAAARAAASSAPVPAAGATPGPLLTQFATRAVQTSAQAPIGIRNNNPGNLRQWGDTPRDAKGYAVFPSMEAGLTAAVRNLVAQQRIHGLNTIQGLISKWAPPSENKTAAYIADLSTRTGFAPDQPLNLQDPKVVAPLISGIVRHEGNGAGVTEEMINRVVAAQLGSSPAGNQVAPQKVEVALTLHGLPAGTSASARTGAGDSMPVRVAYSMPTGITP
jgi:hypothetical protein